MDDAQSIHIVSDRNPSIDITPRLTITIQAPDNEHPEKVIFTISEPPRGEALGLERLLGLIDGVAIGSVRLGFADKETTLSLRLGPGEHGERVPAEVFGEILVEIAQLYEVEPALVTVVPLKDDGQMPLSQYLGIERRPFMGKQYHR